MSSTTVKKLLVSVPAAILLLLLYGIIFGFSAQDGEQSASLSLRISEGCVELLNSLAGGRWSRQFVADLAAYFEHPLRKLAHFGEYTVLGILVYLVWCPWLKRGRGLYVLVLLWVFVSAACDEIHQLFVPGRWGSLADVCLDTAGGAFGMLFCLFMTRKAERRRLKKDRNRVTMREEKTRGMT